MSRIGTLPVALPSGTSVTINAEGITIKGSKGELKTALPEGVVVSQKENNVIIEAANDNRETKAFHGMLRSLIHNMVTGVNEGFTIVMEVRGVGYRAAVQGKDLILNLGFSHEVNFPIPEGVSIKVNKNTELELTSIDKQLVGQTAAKIREYRKPEPYKGKGIYYTNKYGKGGEYVRRKEGKKK